MQDLAVNDGGARMAGEARAPARDRGIRGQWTATRRYGDLRKLEPATLHRFVAGCWIHPQAAFDRATQAGKQVATRCRALFVVAGQRFTRDTGTDCIEWLARAQRDLLA